VLPHVTAREVAGDPGAAETFPPGILVGTILECDAENRALSLRLEAREQELQDLRQSLADHVVEDAEIRGRLRTLEEVIAALHSNLEDLRLQRDQLLADARS
jgi:chromosome segregation ATPase